MKKNDMRQEKPQTLKKRLMAALAMLLISTILMSTTTYAWFVLSTAPEVTGIETQVGANGSLEIVLLNTQTHADMSTIRAGLGGGSLQENQITANNAWGNLVDLSFASYGLGELTLLPARLDVSADGSTVDLNKLLAVPSYGYDGRIITLTRDTATAIYQNNGFLYSGAQDYGVRAIGTSDALSPQGTALASAKTNISNYTKSAKSGAQNALTKNMSGLITIIMFKSTGDSYNDEHKETLNAMLTDLNGVLTYLDNALRQGLIAYAASEVGNEDTFAIVRDRITGAASLSALLGDLAEVGTVPAEFAAWVAQLELMQNNHGLAQTKCDDLTDDDYTWAEISDVLKTIMNMDQILINGKTIGQLDVNSLMSATTIDMTLPTGSGLFADIADFTGNYVVTAEMMGKAVEMATVSTVSPANLVVLAGAVNQLTPADGGDEATALPLTATYGYALDLAFRCNAAMPDLVLQTKGVQRVYNGGENGEPLSESGSTQGGGSYMEFSTKDAGFNLEKRLALMDAVRVGFVDDRGTILGIAKLNVSNFEMEDGIVKAPLYLYEYTFEQDETGMILTMGERKLSDNQITELEQNVAKAVTVVVWLDGDIVDNTMVSATEATSLDGVLNLQFATSAELVPAVDGNVLGYTADKDGLEVLMQGDPDNNVVGANDIAADGQGAYTNVSWNAFTAAYQRAEDVNNDVYASHIAIRNAVEALAEAMLGLEEVSVDALKAKAEEIRVMMGTDANTIGSYVIDDGVNGYMAVTEYTQATAASWTKIADIQSVDHNNNRHNEGNGIYTAKYTDATWNALAKALYQAEAVAMNTKSTDDQINSTLTALVEAEEALTFAVYYVAYEYEGNLYYMAKSEADAEDTYGRWYDSNFKRIVADVTILKLDAYAKAATIAQIGQNTVISNDVPYITPDIDFLENIFPELRDVEVKGVHWNDIDTTLFTELMGSGHYNRLSQLIQVLDTDPILKIDSTSADTAKNAAQELLTKYTAGVEEVTAAQANTAIADLTNAIVDLYTANVENDAAPMNDNLRFMLTAAVNSAKAVEDYANKTELVSATEVAEALLAEDAVATNKQASDALDALNTELEAVDADAITETNTLVQKLPGFDSNKFVYVANYPGVKLKLNDDVTGTTTLNATILTKDGVVTTVSKEITICDKAEGVELSESALSLTVGDTADIRAILKYAAGSAGIEETIVSYTWASTNTAAATVNGTATATVSAVAAGDAQIKLSVTTDCGNTYTVTIPVTVSE